MTEDLNTKIRSVFGEVAVDKGLATRHEVSRLPRFISEYLISRYCNLYHDVEVAFNKLSQVVSENFPEPKDKDRIFYKLKRQGIIRIMDEFKVSVDLKRNIYRLHIPCLQIYDAIADEGTVRRYERILSGMWGLGTLEYRPDILEIEDIKVSPIILIDIEPFQVYNINHKDFIEARSHFSLTEWINLLINTIGLNPSAYNNRQKMLLLARLIPLIEGNVNMMEFGPRATGKTYLYRNLSYYTRIYSGGSVSPARLFYDARIRVIGDLGTHDLIVFDEISKIRLTNPSEMMGKLKDYMESGHYERGDKRGVSTCSLVFMGNIEVELREEGYVPIEDFTYVFPREMRDSAFVDRIHGIIPGWELPKIKQAKYHLSQGYGLASDYFAEILHEMRKDSLVARVSRYTKFSENFNDFLFVCFI